MVWYSFTTPQFGRIEVDGDRARAIVVRRGFHGAGPLEARRAYRLCERCECAPCLCPRRCEKGGA